MLGQRVTIHDTNTCADGLTGTVIAIYDSKILPFKVRFDRPVDGWLKCSDFYEHELKVDIPDNS